MPSFESSKKEERQESIMAKEVQTALQQAPGEELKDASEDLKDLVDGLENIIEDYREVPECTRKILEAIGIAAKENKWKGDDYSSDDIRKVLEKNDKLKLKPKKTSADFR